MAIDRIRSVAVVVSDEKKARQWYVDNLGFEVQDDDELVEFFSTKPTMTQLHSMRQVIFSAWSVSNSQCATLLKISSDA